MGPIGILHFGDPHVGGGGGGGGGLREIYSLCDLINKTDGLFGKIREIYQNN